MTLIRRREERRHRSNKDCSYGAEIGTLFEQEVLHIDGVEIVA